MTNFQKLLGYISRQQAVVAAVAHNLQTNPYDEAVLRAHVPTYYTAAGLLPAKLDKVEVSPVSGKTVGYYSIVCYQPGTGVRHRYSWRYCVRGGRAVEDHAFPVRFG